MNKIEDLMKKAGYSDRAIEYYIQKIHVGKIEHPEAYSTYTGQCGDSMEFYLKIESGEIKDAKFQAMGCAGAFSSGSALCEMVKGKTLGEAEQLDEDDIVSHLGKIPAPKIDCACLAKETLRMAIKQYRKKE
jgi:nitrogen fixation NifU-like protein